MEFCVEGKVCVITGSARGLGLAFAEAVLKARGLVTLTDVLEEEGEAAAARLSEVFGDGLVHFVRCDVTREDDLNRVWDASEAFFARPVSVWVNNAGVSYAVDWRRCVDIDLLGVILGTRVAMERMRDRNGVVVNTASFASFELAPSADRAHYFAAKAGVLHYTRSLGQDHVFKETGIRVMAICPLFADTKLVTEFGHIMEFVRTRYKFRGHLMSPAFVAEAFMELLVRGPSGAALIVMPHKPFLYWPAESTDRIFRAATVARFLRALRVVGDATEPYHWSVVPLLLGAVVATPVLAWVLFAK